MSLPITHCIISAAAGGDEEAFAELVRRMRVNLKIGGWSTWPCECQTPCARPSETELTDLQARLYEELADDR